ncbi:hypothetical protein [Methylobacterium sp. ARG-1]|uniref:hypothetical protein n=1 Tax=Methylobacterium sp. ARG-1 TaxID=1692501 RepID=UPI0006819D88|nr:hypothetical protein [Methylobacterium sp. ARG-1]KNY21072.1 hypothetical protein AKJ13_18910 [Methylobacterium sp. ARG-1]
MNALNALKAQTIRAELARRNASDVEAAALIEAQTTVSDDGRILAVEPNGALSIGSGPGATKPLSQVLDELERTKPALFGAKAAPKAAVITDPAKPGFNLSKALIAARNDPALHAELMDRLAPKPMRVP